MSFVVEFNGRTGRRALAGDVEVDENTLNRSELLQLCLLASQMSPRHTWSFSMLLSEDLLAGRQGVVTGGWAGARKVRNCTVARLCLAVFVAFRFWRIARGGFYHVA